MNRKNLNRHVSEKRKICHSFDLFAKRSIGAISSAEYKRRTIINELYHMSFIHYKTSISTSYSDPFNAPGFNSLDEIIGMELDPRESRCLITITRLNNVTIYNVSRNVDIFEKLMRFNIPRNEDFTGILNSVHWLWDGTVFSIGSMNSVRFWDSCTGQIIETVKLRTHIMNHVIAATKHSKNKYVAAAGKEGHIFMIDMNHGIVITTIKNVEESPIKSIHWNPLNEMQYVTGNDNGNIYLWDIRFQKKCIIKFNNDMSCSYVASHYSNVVAVRFYNNGNNIVSVDLKGGIKTWEVKSGRPRPNYYTPVKFGHLHKKCNFLKEFQFGITENLKQDIAFMPSSLGLKIFDINSGEHLPGTHDVSLSINCATYDPKNHYVYGSTDDLIKLWKPQQTFSNIE